MNTITARYTEFLTHPKGARAIEKYADDVSNVAGAVAGVCALGATLSAGTGVGGAAFGSCYLVAESVSLGASVLHTSVSCVDLDRYCRNSAGATALNFASFGVASAVFPSGSLLSGTDDEVFQNLARWVGGLNVTYFGWLGGMSIDTSERPRC